MINKCKRDKAFSFEAVGESNFLAGKTASPKQNNIPLTNKEKKELLRENDRLKRLFGEKDLEIEVLRDLLKKDPHYRKSKCCWKVDKPWLQSNPGVKDSWIKLVHLLLSNKKSP